MKQNLSVKIQHIIAPQLQQSLNILHMDLGELNDMLSEAAASNPFIELAYPTQKYNTMHLERPRSSSYNMENIASNEGELKDYLLYQIDIHNFPKPIKVLARQITDYIDDNGYLNAKLFMEESTVSSKNLDEALVYLQKLHPTGVYARNLKECLMLQLQENGVWNQQYEIMLDNINLVAKGDFLRLAKLCKIEVACVIHMAEYIKGLNPKPGRNYGTPQTMFMIPDVIVKQAQNGVFDIAFNSNWIPDITIDVNLYKEAINNINNKDEKIYCRNHYKTAKWLAKTVAQRSHTIVRVAKAIVEYQYEFFTYGKKFLKPMTLSQIANQLNMHESTISRISNKCMETPFGIFSIKYFFASEIKSSLYENTYSSKAVKEKIKELINIEDPHKPLSDESIALQLRGEGLIISRRTVAKYREAMKIGPSHFRKVS